MTGDGARHAAEHTHGASALRIVRAGRAIAMRDWERRRVATASRWSGMGRSSSAGRLIAAGVRRKRNRTGERENAPVSGQ
jgi:hypothetical protein